MNGQEQPYLLLPEDGRFGYKWAFGDQIDPVNIAGPGSAPTCPRCGRAVRGLKWLAPHRIELSSFPRKKVGDFVFGAGFDLIASERFRELYNRLDMTGIREWHPVEVVAAGSIPISRLEFDLPKFFLVGGIKWDAARIDESKSDREFATPYQATCSYCQYGGSLARIRSIVIDESSWNGEDFFGCCGAPVTFMISARAAEAIASEKLGNAILRSVLTHEFSPHH